MCLFLYKQVYKLKSHSSFHTFIGRSVKNDGGLITCTCGIVPSTYTGNFRPTNWSIWWCGSDGDASNVQVFPFFSA